MPEGTGLLAHLEKGERLPVPVRKRPPNDVRELRVEDGHLVVPAGLEKKLGLAPGSRLDIVMTNGRAEILPNIHSLNRLYVEPTSRCNLACRTCIRNTWEEPVGDMDMGTFERLAGQLARFPHLETVMFGGFGEPTAHPRILDMIRSVKALGLRGRDDDQRDPPRRRSDRRTAPGAASIRSGSRSTGRPKRASKRSGPGPACRSSSTTSNGSAGGTAGTATPSRSASPSSS